MSNAQAEDVFPVEGDALINLHILIGKATVLGLAEISDGQLVLKTEDCR